jgi:nicotinamidase-related amidase
MAILDPRAVLVVSDAQHGFDSLTFGSFEPNITSLLSAWRRSRRPVVLVRPGLVDPESPISQGHEVDEFDDCVPGRPDVLVARSVHAVFHGVPAMELSRLCVRQVVICGMHTNFTCEAACRLAAEAGYDVLLVADATTSAVRPALTGGLLRVIRTADLLYHDELDAPASLERVVA